jgi:hypothetical protein
MATYEDGPNPILTVVGMFYLSTFQPSVAEILSNLLQRVVIMTLRVNAISAGSAPSYANWR